MIDHALDLWHELFLRSVSGERSELPQKREVLQWAKRRFSEARTDALEEACRAQCEDCRSEVPVHPTETSYAHVHGYKRYSVCRAKRIRKLMDAT